MKKVLKAAGFSLLALVLAAAAVFAVFVWRVEKKRTTPVSPAVTSIVLPADEASLTEGRRLVQVKACADCHGPDLGGKVFIDDPGLGRYVGTNLTRGRGSATAAYTDDDWIRAIRFAVGPDGLPLLGMPAGDFNGISNVEMGRMIAFLKTLAPVDRETPPVRIGPVGYILSNLDQLPLLFPFEEVDLNATPLEDVSVGVTKEYGQYLAMACTGCHGPTLGGGHIPGTAPHWPDARNITPQGRIAQWNFEDFKRVLTEGKTPDGHQIDPQFMPWTSMKAMTETELQALYLYLGQVPGKADGTR